MTPEVQRIAIAEACGWKHQIGETPILKILAEFWIRPNDTECHGFTPPYYLNDLNAMHEAEKVLTLKQLRRMTVEIHDIMTRDPKQDWIPVHHCTAAQRAEAFLRTLGKWEETDTSNLSTVESNTAQHLT